ncbi:heavy-metal-associated domain-containing protein [Streptomyces sp. NPDC055287]
MPVQEPTTPARSITYSVAGMVCNNCRNHVTEAISEVSGVLGVDVDLAAGHVTVTTSGEPDDKAVAEAVDEIGYELAGRV